MRLQKESDQKKESEQKKKSENQKGAKKNEREKENQSSALERKSKRKQKNFYAKVSEIKRAMFSNQPMIVLLYKEALLNTNELDLALPSSIVSLLQECKNVFLEETPHGLPPIRGIEHQIYFVPSATIPNRPAYRSNPEETKELQRQVSELLEKGTCPQDSLDVIYKLVKLWSKWIKLNFHMYEQNPWVGAKAMVATYTTRNHLARYLTCSCKTSRQSG